MAGSVLRTGRACAGGCAGSTACRTWSSRSRGAPGGGTSWRNCGGPGSPRTWPSPPRRQACGAASAAPRRTGLMPVIFVICCWTGGSRSRGSRRRTCWRPAPWCACTRICWKSAPAGSSGSTPAGHGGLVPVGRRPESGAEQAAGAGLGQRHQPQRGISGKAHPVPDPAQPPAVTAGVRDLERVAPVEGDRTQPAEPHPRRARLGQRPGNHLKQGLQRRRAQPPAQIPQRLLRRPRHVQAASPAVSLAQTRA